MISLFFLMERILGVKKKKGNSHLKGSIWGCLASSVDGARDSWPWVFESEPHKGYRAYFKKRKKRGYFAHILTSNSWREDTVVHKPQISCSFSHPLSSLNRQLRYSEQLFAYPRGLWFILSTDFGHFSDVLWSLNWTIKNKCLTVFSHKGHWRTENQASAAGSKKSEGAPPPGHGCNE